MLSDEISPGSFSLAAYIGAKRMLSAIESAYANSGRKALVLV